MNLYKEENGAEIYFVEAPEKKTDATVVIFPGGGYGGLADHEGNGYAEFFAGIGISTFVVKYRVAPAHFPDELLDARRAVRFVRANAEKYGIDKNKVAVMGSSAGGHLAALVSTYTKPVEGEITDETDKEDFLPDMQILCYPVILSPNSGYAHVGSYNNLLGRTPAESAEGLNPVNNVKPTTPRAFIWHTHADNTVDVINSYEYGKALRNNGVSAEIHVFPDGNHGLGLAKNFPHVAQWTGLLKNYLIYSGWLSE